MQVKNGFDSDMNTYRTLYGLGSDELVTFLDFKELFLSL